jgi:flagellar biosynthesis anti-sigma factor FlgM
MRMRINLQSGPQPAPESGRNNPQTGAAGDGVATEEDQAQLSGAHTQVDALTAQASQLSDTGEERLESLRQAVFGGQYQPDPQEVAGALLAHMSFDPALA